LSYTNSKGELINLSQQVRNVLGRAVYQQDKFWIDSELQNVKVKRNYKPSSSKELGLLKWLQFVFNKI